jgi:hypothetical protein
MRKKLCFNCKDPWVPGHKCMGKGEIHYIEGATNNVDNQEEEQDSDAGASSASTRGRTTQRLGIISESETLGVTANLLELIGKMEEDQALGS